MRTPFPGDSAAFSAECAVPREFPHEAFPVELDSPGELDDSVWDAFLPEDDWRDPLPESGDFWYDPDLDEEAAVFRTTAWSLGPVGAERRRKELPCCH